MSNWIFITGGCGYLGSHIAAHLQDTTTYNIMLIDRKAKQLPHTWKFAKVYADEDYSSPVVLNAIRDYRPECIIHCAAESTHNSAIAPLLSWENDVSKTVSLLQTCVQNNISNVIFASSASVYATSAIASQENYATTAYNCNAGIKLAIESMLQHCYRSYNINSVSLRFSNIAGGGAYYYYT